MSDIRKLLESFDNIAKASKNHTGTKFPGYWKAKDTASRARDKMVGDAQESVIKQIHKSAKDTSIKRKLENALQEFKLNEKVTLGGGPAYYDPATGITSNYYAPDDLYGTEFNTLPTAPNLKQVPPSPATPKKPSAPSSADVEFARQYGIQDPNRIQPGQILKGAGPGGADYTVRPGDTISGIRSGQYATPSQSGLSTDVERIAQQNRLADPNRIMPGQKLTMPDGSSYTVKPGDTLYGIERQFRKNQQPTTPATLTPGSNLQNLPSDDARSPDGSSGLPPSAVRNKLQDLPSDDARSPDGSSGLPPSFQPTKKAPDSTSGSGEYTNRQNQQQRGQQSIIPVTPTVPNVNTPAQPAPSVSAPVAPATTGQGGGVTVPRPGGQVFRPQVRKPVQPPTVPDQPRSQIDFLPGASARRSAEAQRRAQAPAGGGLKVPSSIPGAGYLDPSKNLQEQAWITLLREYHKFLEYGNAQDPNAQTTTPDKNTADQAEEKRELEQQKDVATAKGAMSGLASTIGSGFDPSQAAQAAVNMTDGKPLTGDQQKAISALTPLMAQALQTPQTATSLKTALSTAGMLAKKDIA